MVEFAILPSFFSRKKTEGPFLDEYYDKCSFDCAFKAPQLDVFSLARKRADKF